MFSLFDNLPMSPYYKNCILSLIKEQQCDEDTDDEVSSTKWLLNNKGGSMAVPSTSTFPLFSEKGKKSKGKHMVTHILQEMRFSHHILRYGKLLHK